MTTLTVNPSELEVAANVRRDVQLTKEFVASVKLHGVLVPIIVTTGLDGYAVLDGQRRTLAAVEAGLAEVPVVVVDQLEERDRVVTQVVVNDQRAGLSQVDTVAAVADLALFGMSATAIAKSIGESKKAVDVALRVGGSEVAVKAMRDHQASLYEAEVLAEFEDDEVALGELLEYVAQGYGLDHLAQKFRDARAEADVAAQIDAMEGVELIEMPGWDSVDPLPIHNLFVDKKLKVEVTVEKAEEFIGRGLCAFPWSGWADGERTWGVKYAIRGWQDLGLFTHPHIVSRGEAIAAAAKPDTPEAIEAAKAERRAARETTKAWRSATEVRLAWLQKLLARRSMPKGWDLFVAQHLVKDGSGYSAGEWDHILGLLQLTPSDDAFVSRRSVVSEFLAGAPQKASAVALACALAGVEGGYEFDRKGWQHSTSKAYLLLLQGWGYELSEVEAGVVA